MNTPRPMRWLSIDPGDRHVGLATWQGDECLAAVEVDPTKLIEILESFCAAGILETVVYEKFALYAWNEKSMAGNEFLTSQMIGVIKYVCWKHDVPVVGQFASEHKRIYKMSWFRDLTRKELMQLPWWGNGGHAKDAWVIGKWFIRERKRR